MQFPTVPKTVNMGFYSTNFGVGSLAFLNLFSSMQSISMSTNIFNFEMKNELNNNQVLDHSCQKPFAWVSLYQALERFFLVESMNMLFFKRFISLLKL